MVEQQLRKNKIIVGSIMLVITILLLVIIFMVEPASLGWICFINLPLIYLFEGGVWATLNRKKMGWALPTKSENALQFVFLAIILVFFGYLLINWVPFKKEIMATTMSGLSFGYFLSLSQRK